MKSSTNNSRSPLIAQDVQRKRERQIRCACACVGANVGLAASMIHPAFAAFASQDPTSGVADKVVGGVLQGVLPDAFGALGFDVTVSGGTSIPTAGGGAFMSKMIRTVTEIYTVAFPVITVLTALMLVIAFIMRMTGTQQTASKAGAWIVRIIVAYVIFNCACGLFTIIRSTASQAGWGFYRGGS